ncbi:DEAD/DEAH box helicase [Methylohalobius crimeensis]|uniref:DEAD/DEAH box helicase n=1 Tax=Methylohalobius crimeensis TaxID=244365 RepID=UPI0003B54C85|nr:DEAD/DEAH box helicase [Methylohalobius crimeensis]
MRNFHPAVAAWFKESFAAPTDCQQRAWQALKNRRHALIAAPTGSGKTLAAFLSAIDDLVHQAEVGQLTDATHVVYVSPLKALSHDVECNLEQPLAAIQQKLLKAGALAPAIRAQSRTGDTPAATRTAMAKRPPHILVTTPESLYLLLTSESGRRMLAPARTVIVDEIHAVIGSKRGAHLALSLERLQKLCEHPLTRIGLSATQRPLETVARFLLGARPLADCEIIDSGHLRRLDLDIELPDLPLETVLSQEAAKSLYDRIADLIRAHRTTLVFVNTRRQAERVAKALSERLGNGRITSHHGSLSRNQRLDAERRLKAGELEALVATASLELGIDIGEVDLVCQLGITDSVATFLQRVGRAGHRLDRIPKGRLFPTSRDELVTALSLVDAVRRGELETCRIEARPLDVLAQQIVAMAACEDWDEETLFQTIRCAEPYRSLSREAFEEVVTMLAEGYATPRGRRGAHLHRDRIGGRVRGRRGARLTALTCGGAIPDTADYRVILEPSGEIIGTVDEDFAIESLAGDIFQLGNASWRVLRLETDGLRVEDAQGLPPTIPFWFGEAPGRSDVLAWSVSRLREAVFRQFCSAGRPETGLKGRHEPIPGGAPLPSPPPSGGRVGWGAPPSGGRVGWGEPPSEGRVERRENQLAVNPEAVRQAADYLAAAGNSLGTMPTQSRIVLERFFDEAGDLHLIIHSPYGSRVNRAWGLALRKRFCRHFNFELQAAATEDAVLLSLGAGQSFPLDEVKHFLKSTNVRDILTQAVLDNPMFTARWRWNATISLAVRRFQNGRRTPPYLIRMQSEDLVTAVFPEQLACLENIQGDRDIPDHPLVNQTLADCLFEAMDVAGLEAILRGIESGAIEVISRETVEPSPLAAETVNARVYAFLDGAPLEERRVRAVSQRRWIDPDEAEDLCRLDPKAIEQIRREARPDPRDPEELHDALLGSGYLVENEMASAWNPWLETLQGQGRVCRFIPGSGLASSRHPCREDLQGAPSRAHLWIAAENWPQFRALLDPPPPQQGEGWVGSSPRRGEGWVGGSEPQLPEALINQSWTADEALAAILRARMSVLGPVETERLAGELNLPALEIEAALMRLEQEGNLLRGDFGWCERGLLARIHRLTLNTLREAVQPVAAARFMRFLLHWQHVHPDTRLAGPQALTEILTQLEGFEAQAKEWESTILPARIPDYEPAWLDRLCLSGRFVWLRLNPTGKRTPIKNTPIAFVNRRHVSLWRADAVEASPSPTAQRVLDNLTQAGALFFDELLDSCRLLPTQLEDALAELVARGRVSADSFEGLRALRLPEAKKRRYKRLLNTLENAGRWQRLRDGEADLQTRNEHLARKLLKRYGVVFRALAARERGLPPWWELVRIYRRLEAQGEIRGGRFVAGQFGEQFALSEAVTLLRKLSKEDSTEVILSAADPLNLSAILTGAQAVSPQPGRTIRIGPEGIVPGNQLRTSA